MLATKPSALSVDAGSEEHPAFGRQLSAGAAGHTKGGPSCRLVECSAPSPTHADTPDACRLEFAEFRRRIAALVTEFFLSLDIEGMISSINALESESFNDELVAAVLRSSLDHKDAERQAAVALLAALHAQNRVTDAQLMRGFEKLVLTWGDLQLDVPDAPGRLAALLSHDVGLLDRNLFARLPEGLLRCLCRDLSPGPAKRLVEGHLQELSAFKDKLASQIEADLFCNRSIENFAAWLRSADQPAFHHEVVLAACSGSFSVSPSLGAFWTSCLDGPSLAAERGSLALSGLATLMGPHGASLLTEVDVQLGFSRLLGDAEALVATRPEALEHMVAMFRGAVEQEILPAEFLKSARRLRFGGAKGVEVLRAAQRQTPMFSRRVWGTGDARQFRTEVRDAILEYFDSHSIHELSQIIQELHLSLSEQVQFVRKLLVTGMERGETDMALDAVAELTEYCWSAKEVREAFEQIREVTDDLVLDFPSCREKTGELVRAAAGRGLLEEAYLVTDTATVV